MEKRPMPLVGAYLVDHAQWIAEALQLSVFPVKQRDKRPYAKPGFHAATTDPAQIAAWWDEHPNASIGVPMGHGLWALDIDERYEGLAALRKLEETFGQLPWTVTNLTGSHDGSKHLIWREPHDVEIRKGKLCPGIDIQGLGSYIIVPPSLHPSGNRYAWELDYGPDDCDFCDAPDWLIDLVTQPRHSADGYDDEELCAYDPDAQVVEGDRNNAMYRLLRPHGLAGKGQAWLQEYGETVSQACYLPPLDASEIAAVVTSALKPSQFAQIAVNGHAYGPGVPHERTLAPVPHLNTAPPGQSDMHMPRAAANDNQNWRSDLFYYKITKDDLDNGLPASLKENAFNIGQILRYHPYWQDAERELWLDDIRHLAKCGEDTITPNLVLQTAQWFGGVMRLAITRPRLVQGCMESEAAQKPRDLLQYHVNALPQWDGEPRLHTWLRDISGAADDAMTRAVSWLLPVSMIARAVTPGCQYRSVVILEGKENAGKSHLLRALATPEWYLEFSDDMEGKEAHMIVEGRWIVEFGEVNTLLRTNDARMKSFITLEEDTYIPKYANEAVHHKRRAILVGTSNFRDGYLQGQTGNTRYLPLWIGDTVDLSTLRALRDQIMAEAKRAYEQRLEDWWEIPDDAEELFKLAREERREPSVYESDLRSWLETGRFAQNWYHADTGLAISCPCKEGMTNWNEIAQGFLKMPRDRWADKRAQNEITKALRALGWLVRQHKDDGKINKNWWFAPDHPQATYALPPVPF